MRLLVPFASPCTDEWLSHAVYSLCRGMAEHDGVDLRLLPQSYTRRLAGDPILAQPVPSLLHWPLFRLDRSRRWLRRLHARACARHLSHADAVWFWPDNDLALYERARDEGKLIVHEMINCHLATVRRVLEAESRSIGAPVAPAIDDARIAEENGWLEHADLVFAPSPAVRDSLLEAGVPAAKVSLTSYGFSPRRIRPRPPAPPRPGKAVACFVGRLSLRKGVHLLLRAFEDVRDAVDLVFCGTVSDEVRAFCGERLGQPGVRVLGHVPDVSSVLDRADMLLLSSLEEGSPLVTYEAMAKGLPVVVSPMGSGGVVRDGVEGFVVDPHDTDRLAERVRLLAKDPELRAALGRRGAETARDYTWERVAERRLAAIRARGGDALPATR